MKNKNNSRRGITPLLLTLLLSIAACPQLRAANVEYNFSVNPPTAGFPMDLTLIGSTTGITPKSAILRWGDDTDSDAYVKCTSTLQCSYFGYQHEYPQASTIKTYHAQLNVTTASGSTFTLTKNITVYPYEPTDFLIVSIGDSVASGEGNPVISGRVRDLTTGKLLGQGGLWDYGAPGCHGSSWAGPAQAAQQIRTAEEQALSKAGRPNTPNVVTFIHIACSGAALHFIYSEQLQKVAQLLSPLHGKIDALLITGGADDIDNGFGHVIDTCIGPVPKNPVYPTHMDNHRLYDPSLDCSVHLWPGPEPTHALLKPTWLMQKSLHYVVGNGFSSSILSDSYSSYSFLKNQLDSGPPILSLPDTASPDSLHSVVYVTSYYDPTRNAVGKFPTNYQNDLCSGNLLMKSEWKYLYFHMLIPMNEDIYYAAQNNGWHYVSGPMHDFLHHGVCAGTDHGTSWAVQPKQTGLR